MLGTKEERRLGAAALPIVTLYRQDHSRAGPVREARRPTVTSRLQPARHGVGGQREARWPLVCPRKRQWARRRLIAIARPPAANSIAPVGSGTGGIAMSPSSNSGRPLAAWIGHEATSVVAPVTLSTRRTWLKNEGVEPMAPRNHSLPPAQLIAMPWLKFVSTPITCGIGVAARPVSWNMRSVTMS